MEPTFPNQKYTSIETAELETLRMRVLALEDWKAHASKVLDGINLQDIAKEIGVQLGHDIGPKVLPWIKAAKVQGSLRMKPHVFAQMVNEIRDLAMRYSATGSFRDRASGVLGKYVSIDLVQPGCRVRLPGIGLCGDQYGAGSGRVQLCPECAMKQEREARAP